VFSAGCTKSRAAAHARAGRAGL